MESVFYLALLYLLFVPYGSKTVDERRNIGMIKMTASQWRTTLGLAVVAAAIVLSNVMITVRIPSVVEQIGHGTAQTAGVILAAMQFVGILAGLAFSPLTQLFRDRLLVVSEWPMVDPNVDRGFYQSLDARHCDHPCRLRLQCSS